MYRTSRSIIVLIALSMLLALPLAAGARGLDNPRPAASVAEGWLGATLNWFQDVLGLRGQEGRRHTASSPAGFQTKEESGSTNVSTGGPCIDPQGRPKPWCL